MNDGTMVQPWGNFGVLEKSYRKLYGSETLLQNTKKVVLWLNLNNQNDHTDLGPENKRYFCLKDG